MSSDLKLSVTFPTMFCLVSYKYTWYGVWSCVNVCLQVIFSQKLCFAKFTFIPKQNISKPWHTCLPTIEILGSHLRSTWKIRFHTPERASPDPTKPSRILKDPYTKDKIRVDSHGCFSCFTPDSPTPALCSPHRFFEAQNNFKSRCPGIEQIFCSLTNYLGK